MKFFKTTLCLALALVFLGACSKSDSTPKKTLTGKWFFASKTVLDHFNNSFNNYPLSGNSYMEIKTNNQAYAYFSETGQAISTATGTWTQIDDTHIQLNWTSGTGTFTPTSTTFTIMTFTNSALVLQHQWNNGVGRLYTQTEYFTK